MYPYGNDQRDEYYQPTPRTAATFNANGFEERILIPSLKALIVAIPAGLLAGLLIGAFKIQVSIWYVMPITSLVIFLVTFWGSSQRGQWLIERLTGADLNKDGFIGQPLPALPTEVNNNPLPVLLARNDEQEMSGVVKDLPHRDLLPLLAAGLLSGERKFSQREWADEISQPAFYDIQRAFVAAGLAKPNSNKGGNNGYSLTKEGVDTCKTILEQVQKERDTTALPYFPK